MTRAGFITIHSSEYGSLRPLFRDTRPGPQVGSHVACGGRGVALADRWPDPRVVVAGAGHDAQLAGEPGAFVPEMLDALPRPLFVACPPEFEPVLKSAAPGMFAWDRVIFRVFGAGIHPIREATIRRLEPVDASRFAEFEDDVDWISRTHGGPDGVARSGLAWGGFVGGKLASVALPYHMGERFEDIGVITRANYRGRGLSPACASRLVRDVRRRGHEPSWSTSPDNTGSIRVVQKLGARKERDDVLFVIGPADGGNSPA